MCSAPEQAAAVLSDVCEVLEVHEREGADGAGGGERTGLDVKLDELGGAGVADAGELVDVADGSAVDGVQAAELVVVTERRVRGEDLREDDDALVDVRPELGDLREQRRRSLGRQVPPVKVLQQWLAQRLEHEPPCNESGALLGGGAAVIGGPAVVASYSSCRAA